jgi:predicted  nucleic acid-binding Zn-ribbon protein
MHPAIPHLIELQRVDHRIGALRSELESYPKRVQEADARLTAARAAVAAAKEAHTNALKERKKFELDVDQWKDRARKYRDQSGSVKTNEAYKALLHEIANAEAEVAKAEDRQLEVMMNGEEFERRVRHAEADLKETETSVSADRKAVQALNTEKHKQLAVALAEREKVIAPVPEDLRELYTRIAKRHHGTAMAQVRDDQCRGCGMRVLPHIIQELRQETNEELYRCEMCGLILYTLDPIPVANPGSDGGKSPASEASSSPPHS